MLCIQAFLPGVKLAFSKQKTAEGKFKMQTQKRAVVFLISAAMAAGMAYGAGVPAPEQQGPKMPQVIEQYSANRMSLSRTYPVEISPTHVERMEKFYNNELAMLTKMDFQSLSHEDQVDYLLLKHKVHSELHQIALEKGQNAEMKPLLPFAPAIEDLMTGKRLM